MAGPADGHGEEAHQLVAARQSRHVLALSQGPTDRTGPI